MASTRSGRWRCAVLAMAGLAAGPGLCATGEAVDPKFTAPVPQEQRKIGVGEEKSFQDGALTLAVLAAERAAVDLKANGGAAMSLPHAKQAVIDAGNGKICTVVFMGLVGKRATLSAGCETATDELKAALLRQSEEVGVERVDPAALVASSPKDTLRNPYLGDPRAIAEGHQLFMGNSCNGCHGGTGGGGIGPAFTNGVWVYGNADDTLFRLVTLGSDGLHEAGYARRARESVVAPMPSFTGIIESADELWKILAWVRSVSLSDAPPLR